MEAPSRSRLGRSIRRIAARLSAVVLAMILALGVGMIGAAPASAQGFGWFGGLFGGGQPRQPPRQGYPSYNPGPAYPGYDAGSPVYDAPRHRPRRRRPPVEQAQKEAPPKDKTPPKNASLFVDVFGDSMGQMLASGLDDAFSDRQDVAVVHKAKGSTGLVATDFFDWPKAISDTLDEKGEDKGKKVDVAVMMIGTNDRQPIRQDGKTYAPGTPDWVAIYRKRVEAIDEAFRKKGVPLVWVGVPITKNDDFADDMAAFNDLYREAAAKAGATYVDTWEAFSDDDGDFSAFGPDVNGQTVRLRAADGIHFTRAGARKLAHFVETHVRRDLDGKVAVPTLPTDAPAVAAAPGVKPPVIAAAKPDAGPIKSLNEAPAASDGQLSAVAAYRDLASRDALLQSSLVRGQGSSAPSGRADDTRWSAAAGAAGN